MPSLACVSASESEQVRCLYLRKKHQLLIFSQEDERRLVKRSTDRLRNELVDRICGVEHRDIKELRKPSRSAFLYLLIDLSKEVLPAQAYCLEKTVVPKILRRLSLEGRLKFENAKLPHKATGFSPVPAAS